MAKTIGKGMIDLSVVTQEVVSAGIYSLGHGGNDAQKTMGIITGLLLASGALLPQEPGKFHVPLWVVLVSHAAIAFGTMFGGRRIVWAWVITIPISALVAALSFWAIDLFW